MQTTSHAEDYPRFHLALPVTDLDDTLRFYTQTLGCATGRSAERWVDLDFFGHQLVLHRVEPQDHPTASTNAVDGHAVPASHFGPVLAWDDFHAMAERLRAAGVDFVIEPYLRFEGLKGEQATMFIADPSGNHLEFKTFKDISMLFATDLEQEAT
ncbi:MAG: VOC family protein [Wenzhouxiangella sp.]|jgi:extradiol dioxygenase family protein|nr:VOC family protein [Wenzhouxiangella sp.]